MSNFFWLWGYIDFIRNDNDDNNLDQTQQTNKQTLDMISLTVLFCVVFVCLYYGPL